MVRFFGPPYMYVFLLLRDLYMLCRTYSSALNVYVIFTKFGVWPSRKMLRLMPTTSSWGIENCQSCRQPVVTDLFQTLNKNPLLPPPERYMFYLAFVWWSVCLCLLASLCKNYWLDLDENFDKDIPLDKEGTIYLEVTSVLLSLLSQPARVLLEWRRLLQNRLPATGWSLQSLISEIHRHQLIVHLQYVHFILQPDYCIAEADMSTCLEN